MTRLSRSSTPGLLGRHLRSSPAPALLLATLVFAAVLAVALAPRALLALGDDELRTSLQSASPALRDITGTGHLGVLEESPDVGRFIELADEALAELPDDISPPLRSALGETRWIARGLAGDALPPVEQKARVLLTPAVDVHRDDDIRYLDGSAPTVWTPPDPDQGSPDEAPSEDALPIEVAVSELLAEELSLEVGDRLDYFPAPLLVTGVYAPRDPSDRYWVHAPDLAAPSYSQSSQELPTLRASFYVDPLTMEGLSVDFTEGKLAMWIPVDTSALRYADGAALQVQAREVIATRAALPNFGEVNLRTGLADAVDRVIGRVSGATALLALVGSGLAGVLVAVLALGVLATLQRRTAALALALARGAAPWQIRSILLLEGLLVAIPAGALALAVAAAILPADVGAEGWLLPLGTALATPVLFAALAPTRALRPDRADLRVQARSPLRWVIEAAVLGLAVVSLVLLARRGLVGTSAAVGIDPLLAAMPVLLAAAVCVLLLRIYPAPMLAVQAATRRGSSPTGLVGAARVVRDPAFGFPAVLALVVGVAIVVASATLASTTRGALEQAAQDSVGADLRLEAASLPDDVVARVAGTDGVAAAAALAVAERVDVAGSSGPSEVSVLVADADALASVRDDVPALPSTPDVIALRGSSDWAKDAVGEELELAGAAATVAGVIPVDALPGVSRQWVLVDSADLGRLDIDPPVAREVLVRLDEDADPVAVAAALTKLAADAQITATARNAVTVLTTEQELREARAAPTVGGLERFLAIAAAVALLLTVLAVLLGSIAAAASRGRFIAVLRVLGLSRRQVRSLLVWELAPVAAMAGLVGTGLGLVLPLIIVNVLDLRPFIGGSDQPGVTIDALWVAGGVAAFLVTVVLAGAVAAAVSRRIVPAGALKMGDT